MTLTFKHFDTRLNQWLHSDNNTANSESLIKEELDNTLLEFFLPDKQFSFGQIDQYSRPDDLKNHPDGHKLLLASGDRLVYGSAECLEVIDKLCPDRKDQGAYGSIFLGSCNNAINEKLNILIVDDKTGDNGGIVDTDQAKRLTGDCYGQIDPKLYDLLTERELGSEKAYAVVQHRFGWREGDGQDSSFRFGKGTLRPHKIDELKYADSSNTPKIDLIIPLSSFKGTDKDNPKGATKPQIQPGLYNQTIWIGEKSQSQQGKTAVSQLLASFPQGLKDFIEIVEAQAKELTETLDDPRLIAQLYCKSYEKRLADIAERKNEENIDIESLENGAEDSSTEAEISGMYKIIKADVESGHYQLLETEKVKQELSRFVQKQWKEIATGRSLTFDRGMIIPSKDLVNGEICVPWIKPDEKVLNFRSPFLNSNGLCVSTNKIVDDCLGPDGQALEGVIVVNDEDYERMRDRLLGKGISLEAIPNETESERQARDFDGDCIGVELASEYPNLTREAEYRNQKENAYNPTVKQQKQSFYEPDGTQKDFEEIALYMTGGNVGTINNQVTALEALESEIEVLKTYGTPEQQSSYIGQVAEHYQKLFYLERKEVDPQPIRPEYKGQMVEFVKLAKTNNPENTLKAMAINHNIYRNLIEEGCYQNQVAVDMLKSSKAPDMDLVNENRRYLYRKVNYIKDKKDPQTYLEQPIDPSGNSPVELLISQTNKYFEGSQLESRMAVQFSSLFKDVDFSAQEKNAAIVVKHEYDQKTIQAIELNNRLKTDPGPSLKIVTETGKSLEITNIAKYGHPLALKGKNVNLKLQETPDHPPRILAVAQIDSEMEQGKPKYRELGTVARQDVITHQLKAGMVTKGEVAKIVPEIQKGQVDLLFTQAKEIATDFYQSIPENEVDSAAAAAWSISTTRENEDVTPNNRKKVSSFVFVAFSNEIAARLGTLQFDKFVVSGIDRGDLPLSNHQWSNEQKYPIEIVKTGDPKFPRAVSITDPVTGYQGTAAIENRSSLLPLNTTALAVVCPSSSATITATVATVGRPPIEFTIREVSKFDYSNRVFQSHEAKLTIGSSLIPNGNVKIKLDGKVLGELDPDAARQLKEMDYLKEGNVLKLKLKFFNINSEQGAFVIGSSPKGNLLKINKINHYEFAGKDLSDSDYKVVELSIPQAKRKDAVFLDNKLLGVLHFNKDKEVLKNIGLLHPSKLVEGNYKLDSNFTTATVTVDPTTVIYPQTWIREQNFSNDRIRQSLSTNENILALIKERPTLLIETGDNKILGLAADKNKLGVIDHWLKISNVKFTLKATANETKKGMIVFNLSTETIAPKVLEKLEAKFGKPLNSIDYHNRLEFVPKYRSNLEVSQETALSSSSLLIPIGTSNAQRVNPLNNLQPINNAVISQLIEKDVATSEAAIQTLDIASDSSIPNTDDNSNRALPNQSAAKFSDVDSQSLKVERAQWEKNLVEAALQSLNVNSTNLDCSSYTAPLGSNHSIIYITREQQLTITNKSSRQVIYQAIRGQAANICNLSEEQKNYYHRQIAEPVDNVKTKSQVNKLEV